MRKTPSDIFPQIAWGWLVVGLLGLAVVAAIAVSHYIFGVPEHGAHGGGSHALGVATNLVAMGSGFGLFAVLGGWFLILHKKR